jgi:hypothetical protein
MYMCVALDTEWMRTSKYVGLPSALLQHVNIMLMWEQVHARIQMQRYQRFANS